MSITVGASDSASVCRRSQESDREQRLHAVVAEPAAQRVGGERVAIYEEADERRVRILDGSGERLAPVDDAWDADQGVATEPRGDGTLVVARALEQVAHLGELLGGAEQDRIGSVNVSDIRTGASVCAGGVVGRIDGRGDGVGASEACS